ncbi:TPA: hypothetical protein ACS8DH_001182 [Providencia alcalifaciens]
MPQDKKTFSRTPGGIKAQGSFYKSDIIVYIEGKNLDSGIVYDKYYYQTIFLQLASEFKFKIKILGNCSDVLNMYHIILSNNINNTLCIIDRDYAQISHSKLTDEKLISTYGYSWESDFWSKDLCRKIIKQLVFDDSSVIRKLNETLLIIEKRLGILHKINLAASICGSNIFKLGKKGGSDGINIDNQSVYLISNKEIKRHMKLLKNNPSREEIILIYKKINAIPSRLIQGHYWEFTILNLICSLTKKHSLNNCSVSHSIVKDIAFTQFKNYFSECFSSKVSDHYETKIKLFLNQIN